MNRSNPHRLPSALEQESDLRRKLSGKRLCVFLDYDGTLTPIVSQPEEALLSDEMRDILRKLAGLCTVAIISGRDRADVEKLVSLDELVYAGSHGFDISGPGGMRMVYEEGKQFLPDLDRAEKDLYSELARISGARVERKRFAIAVHYRNVSEENAPRIKDIVHEVFQQHSGLKKGPGKKVIELKPDIDWDKGKALLWLLEKLDLDHDGVIPLYIGDDLTDEDALRALAERGIGILVGEHGQLTYARYKLEDVDEVKQFLCRLVETLGQD